MTFDLELYRFQLLQSELVNFSRDMPAVIKRQGTVVSRALVLDPAARVRKLSDHGSSVKIDNDIPIKRYFRSGAEMERQVRGRVVGGWVWCSGL